MELRTEHTKTGNGSMLTDHQRGESTRRALWAAAAVLWLHRRLIAGATALAAVLAVVASLMLPNWYAATARVLVPDSSGTSISAVLGKLSPAAASLLGGSKGDYTRYLAILTSRSMSEAAINEFGLVDVYEKRDKRYPMDATLKELEANTTFDIDLKYNFLSVEVVDRSPQRAAAMANFFVTELNRVNSELAAQNASAFRRYVEKRYHENLAAIDSSRMAMQRFQESHGVIELPRMAEAYIQSMAQQRALATQGEIRYEALRNQLGPDNPQVRSARELIAAARRKEQEMMSGQSRLMPVPVDALPAMASQYARLYQDVLVQSEILQVIQPLFEQARFEEEREKIAVQIVDLASEPERHAKPKRSVLVLIAVLSMFLLSILIVLFYDWLTRNRSYLAHRLGQVGSA
jgi:tyrosine-protein kinase Etk/Wzc